MTVLIGTRDGVFRAPTVPIGEAERVLDGGDTPRIRTFPAVEGAFAATETGLYRSTDGGVTWTDLGVPQEEVYSVVAGPDGDRLYAGTHPARLYVSTDGGATWRECDGLQALPSRGEWHTPRHRDEAHVRSLGVHAGAPDRVIAGVEVGGVHVSEDRGETWTERRDGVHDDVHHVLVLGPEEYVASCGGGLYRTRNAGRSWTEIGTGVDHRYFREAVAVDGRLYASAARGPPGTWRGADGADAVLLESTGRGETLDAVPYLGGPAAVVLAWTDREGRVLAGTNDGHILGRDARGWAEVGTVPAGVRSLATY
jgi:photosystem II stability/assembly factor-like uncharacterized protein